MQIVLIAMDYSNVYKIFLKDQTVFKNTCLKILSLHSCCMSCNFVSKVTRVLQYQISRITWLWSRIPPLYHNPPFLYSIIVLNWMIYSNFSDQKHRASAIRHLSGPRLSQGDKCPGDNCTGIYGIIQFYVTFQPK